MSKKISLDFNCRQYIDFEKEFDSSLKEDAFFDDTKNFRSEDKNSSKLPRPNIYENGKDLTDSDENKLVNKMTAALSMLENTPKIKKSTPRGKLFAEKFAKGICPKMEVKSTVKPNTVPAALRKSRRSRSLTTLNTAKTNKTRQCGLRRSSSLNDLRCYKRTKYPVTPMCLKRTIKKAKERLIKTTEERELDEIKKLQQQLILHLRQNEITLRKLNLKPRQGTIPKMSHRCDNLKESKRLNVLAEKSNIAEKESRKNIPTLSQAALKKETMVVKHSSESADNTKIDNAVSSRKSKHLVSTTDSDLNKSTVQRAKKSSHRRIMDHSGIMFLPTVKSNFPIKPFLFESKAKEMKSEVATSTSKQKSVSEVFIDKENIPYGVRSSAVKTREIKNAKCDSTTSLEPMKIVGKQATNSLKGTPFAENITRN